MIAAALRMTLSAALLAVAAPALATPATAAPLRYPDAPRGPVVDDYFGTQVPDPYRWLEDVDAPATVTWVKAQQALTTPLIEALPERAPLLARLQVLWNYERRSAPERVAGRSFWQKNDGLQNQPVLIVQDAPGGTPRVLLDPNTLSADGITALTQWKVSPSGTLVAYLLAEAGSDWETLRVREVATGTDRPDMLARVKFSGIAWLPGETGLLYSRYPEAPAKAAGSSAAAGGTATFEALAGHSLYRHVLGTPQSADALVYRPENDQWNVSAEVTDDGRYAVVSTVPGATEESRLSVFDLGAAGAGAEFLKQPVAVIGEGLKNAHEVVGNVGSTLYVLTNDGAPKKRVVAVPLDRGGAKPWRTVVPEGRDVIVSAYHVGGQLLVRTLRDAASQLVRYSLKGRRLGTVKLPGLGAVEPSVRDTAAVRGEPDNPIAYFEFTSFAEPHSIYRLDLASGKVSRDWAPTLPFDPAAYVTEQVFYKSRDGARVPMFISYKKGLKKDGTNPTLLYGYGGFNINLVPNFSPQNLAWMEMGGVYAQPNLRGGGEYGEPWHAAGTKERKQNVFNDFAAAAETLIAKGYTSAKHLGIHGRSNGGLLVGATLNQRPDLFAAAVPGVGVMDMLRFHLPSFTIGHAWRGDYGSSETAEGFGYLFPYSPVHNVRPGAAYPPTLTITADHDDRVVPGHSFKYAAAMQWANPGNPNPQLIRIEERGGHGAGKPTAKKIEEVADVLAFLRHYTK